MQKIVIIGGGGLAREVVDYVRQDITSGQLGDAELFGVVDGDRECQVATSEVDVPLFVDLSQVPQSDGLEFLVAIGSASRRRIVAEELNRLGGKLFTYIHPMAIIASDAEIGAGAIIAPGAVINAGAKIGVNCFINVLASVGHGAAVGSHTVVSPFSAVSGDCKLGEACFLGTRSSLLPLVSLGDNCTVDAHTAVRHSVGDRKIISDRGRYRVLDDRLANSAPNDD